jgi:hypothetical protein
MFIEAFEHRMQAATKYREALEYVDADPELIRLARLDEGKIAAFFDQACAEFRDPKPERFDRTFKNIEDIDQWPVQEP